MELSYTKPQNNFLFWHKSVYQYGFLLVVMLNLWSCGVKNNDSGLPISANKEERFLEQIGGNIDIDEALLAVKFSDEFPHVWELYNTSDRPLTIISNNNYFFRAYCYAQSDNEWKEITLPTFSVDAGSKRSLGLVLPPNLTHYSPDVENIEFFFQGTYENINCDNPRFLFLGEWPDGSYHGYYEDLMEE